MCSCILTPDNTFKILGMVSDGPPKLISGSGYLQWKRDVDIWQIGTNVPAAKQAAVAILKIEDAKAREYATRLDHTELKKAAGLAFLLKELDKYYKEDSTQCIFIALDELEKFRRGSLSITKYIAEFHNKVDLVRELLRAQAIEKNTPADDAAPAVPDLYHDSILAYKLLAQADLTDGEIQLVKAGMGQSALTINNVEGCLKRLFGDKVLTSASGGSSSRGTETVRVKVEPVDQETYYNEEDKGEDTEETFYSYNQRPRGGSNYYKNKGWRNQSKDKSPRKEQGIGKKNQKYQRSIKRCFTCDSKMHLSYDCPHNTENADEEGQGC